MTIPALRFQKVSCRVSRTQHGSNRSKWKLDPRDGQMGKLLIQKNINFCIRQVSQKVSSPLPSSKASGSTTLSPITVRDVLTCKTAFVVVGRSRSNINVLVILFIILRIW